MWNRGASLPPPLSPPANNAANRSLADTDSPRAWLEAATAPAPRDYRALHAAWLALDSQYSDESGGEVLLERTRRALNGLRGGDLAKIHYLCK